MNNGTLLQAKTTLIRSHQKSEELSTPFLFLVACFEQAVIIASIIKGDK